MKWGRPVFFGVLVLALVGAGVLYSVNYVDPVRILYKRLTATSPYDYDEIDPRFAATDPAELITVRSPQAAALARTRLSGVIWGAAGEGRNRLARVTDTNFQDALFNGFDSLTRVEELEVDVYEYTTYTYHLRPAKPNGALVVYAHGYAGTFGQHARHLQSLVAAGYGVLAINYPGYGKGSFPAKYSHQRFLKNAPFPLRVVVEPVTMSLNAVLRAHRYEQVHMIGFSAGGWLTTLLAAVDTRIKRSYPVAGVYPLYLHEGLKRQPPAEHFYRPLTAALGYLDMFVLGAFGPDRRQLQIFNRYDRCCYRNTKGRLYADAVDAAVTAIGQGGSFAVFIDETHPHHHISDHAMGRILVDLEESLPITP